LIDCPTENELQDFIDGTVSGAALDALHDHVDRCSMCRRTLAATASARSTIGRYQIVDVLGSGGMGVVYDAYDPELDRKIAVKLVRAAGRQTADHQSRLTREAQTMAQLSHPNVVAVYDVGAVGDQVFIAMERVEGRTLASWLVARARSTDEVVTAFVAAGHGVAAAHGVGIAHGDFKPGNVLVGIDGRVRVTDFGLARPLSRTTIASGIDGTPAFMAPEQRAGAPPSAAADQFSFCVALDSALGTDHSRSRALRRVIARGRSAEPADRYPSMTELLDALDRSHRHRMRWLALAVPVAAIVAIALWPATPAPRSAASCGGAAGATCKPDEFCSYRDEPGNVCGVGGEPGHCSLRPETCEGFEPRSVCGCDATTYVNPCEARLARVAISYQEACHACNGPSDAPCRPRQYCQHAPDLGRGVCMWRPALCFDIDAPVCADNQVTYPNRCEARRAGFDVLHDGAC
jgi:predicted Ser/Thr protein kinase